MHFSVPFHRAFARPTLVLAVLGLAGCGGTAFDTSPSMMLAERFSRPAPVATTAPADSRWWQGFGDPVLDRLMDRALMDNPTLGELRARLREAEAQARSARGLLRGNGNLTAVTNSDAVESRERSLTALLDPETVGGWRGRGAQARTEAARMGLADTRRRVLADLAVAYVDLRHAQQVVVHKEQDLRSRRRTLSDIETQLGAGAATRLDLVRAQALVAEAEAELPGLGADVVRAKNRLSTLVGRPVGLLDIDLGFAGRQPRPAALAGFGVPADLLRQRPDIRRAEALYAAALADVGSARAARWPSLTLTGLIRTPVGGPSSRSSELGLILPVFNQGALAAEVDAAEARVDQAYAQWRQTVLSAVEEVETGLATLDAAARATRAADRALALDLEALDLSRKLLDSRGNITVLDLLDRERSVSAARSTLAGTLRRAATEYIQLQSALGGGVVAVPAGG